jgi:hypothetical protein
VQASRIQAPYLRTPRLARESLCSLGIAPTTLPPVQQKPELMTMIGKISFFLLSRNSLFSRRSARADRPLSYLSTQSLISAINSIMSVL